MKISVCGKGGSGKSIIVALLANEAQTRGYKVLVVDSDESNVGLYQMLGFDRPPSPLMELVGGKKSVQRKMLSSFSSEEAEPQMNLMAQDKILLESIPSEYLFERDGVRLVGIGKILQSLEGCACPMGVLSREFLKKLYLRADEVAIVDMEAGVEHFGRGVETSIDSVLIVVEPSLESLQLTERIKSLASGIGVDNIWAVLNKVPSGEIASKLKEELGKRSISVIASIPYSPEIFEACLDGHLLGRVKVPREVGKIVDRLLSQIQRE